MHCTVGMAARRSAAPCGETCGWHAMVRAARRATDYKTVRAALRAAVCACGAGQHAAAAKGVRRYCAAPHKALPRTRAQYTGQHKV